MKHFAIYTGPTLVQHVSQWLKRQGFTVLIEGVMRVWVEADSADELLVALKKYGSGWSIRDIQQITSEIALK